VIDVTKYYPDEKPVDGLQIMFTLMHFVHQHVNCHELISTLVSRTSVYKVIRAIRNAAHRHILQSPRDLFLQIIAANLVFWQQNNFAVVKIMKKPTTVDLIGE